MDLDKLKRVAKDTLKKVTAKDNPNSEDSGMESDFAEYTEQQDEPEIVRVSDDSPDSDMARTQRFDFKSMLDMFTKKGHDISVDDLTGDTADNTADPYNDEPSAADVAGLKTSINRLDTDVSKIISNQAKQLEDINESLDSVKTELREMREYSLDVNTKLGNIDDGINLRLGPIEKKLSEISNAVASVSKLNDSIFDLKNAQMNTKNSLTDLEMSFTRLKKKMTVSNIIISILAAVIVFLEVINLLS